MCDPENLVTPKERVINARTSAYIQLTLEGPVSVTEPVIELALSGMRFPRKRIFAFFLFTFRHFKFL